MDRKITPLPCPFCGGEARIEQMIKPIIVHGHEQYPYMVGCDDPECILYLDQESRNASLMFAEATTREQIIAKWNRRFGDVGTCDV